MRTEAEAIKIARKRAHFTHEVRFVVFDRSADNGEGPYHVATEEDLDTFFDGIPERDILFCTDEVTP